MQPPQGGVLLPTLTTRAAPLALRHAQGDGRSKDDRYAHRFRALLSHCVVPSLRFRCSVQLNQRPTGALWGLRTFLLGRTWSPNFGPPRGGRGSWSRRLAFAMRTLTLDLTSTVRDANSNPRLDVEPYETASSVRLTPGGRSPRWALSLFVVVLLFAASTLRTVSTRPLDYVTDASVSSSCATEFPPLTTGSHP